MAPEVSIEELDLARTAGAALVDVRETAEHAQGHGPGAQHMPLGIVPVRLHELPNNEPLYDTCASGGRRAQAAELFENAGLDSRSVAGGTTAWIHSGRPMDTGSPRNEQ